MISMNLSAHEKVSSSDSYAAVTELHLILTLGYQTLVNVSEIFYGKLRHQ